ncbi:MAG: hypothetical protein P1U41_02055 [Vicingaceae bacterium]|nr:hypothetical protein [Vicingaceae bacterium]
MFYLFISILIICTILTVYFLFKEFQEVSYLKGVLSDIIGKDTISEVNDLIKIKNFLNRNIKYNDKLKSQKRPLLRNTASQTLKTGLGFCGENARLAIKILILGSIKARRIYLFRKVWQHVLVEHSWKGSWFMFDGHYDPDTLLNDHNVTKIRSEKINQYPNDYPNNPYLDFCRIKLFYIIRPLRFMSKIKLPISFVYLMESPLIIKSLICFVFTLTASITLLNYWF